MTIARKLSYGTASWLNFEFQCGRGHLFEEKYLSVPIGQILTSQFGENVISEYDHPHLVQYTNGRGKKPKIDFVVEEGNDVTYAIEVKWAGQTLPKEEDIIWDLIRLELMSHFYNSKAIFIIAGQNKRINKLLESDAFCGCTNDESPRPILKTGNFRSMGFKLDNPIQSRIKSIKSLSHNYNGLRFPCKISTKRPVIYPSICNTTDFQVYVWELTNSINRTDFNPQEHSLYR
jgi:hypothetical protein